MPQCMLEPENICIECGECDACDLDPNKICDNCCRCLGDADYRAVEVTEIIMPDQVKMKYKKKAKPE